MAKKIVRKLSAIRNFLTPLQVRPPDDDHFLSTPTLEPYSTERRLMAQHSSSPASRHSSDQFPPSDEEVEKINRDRLEKAKLSQTYKEMAQSSEALNLTLKSQHRLLVATLITALVALIVGVISLFNKPPIVNVRQPSVNIQPPVVNVQPPDIYVNTAP